MLSRKSKKSDNETSNSQYKVRLSVTIGGKTVESDLEDSLYIPTVDKLNPTMLSNMMSNIPSLHARWNFLYNEAVYDFDILKTKIEVWTARKGKEYRDQLSKKKEGRVTDKMVDEMIKLDPEFKSLNDELALAKKSMKHVLAQANGFGEMGEKIVNIASMMKWEGENLAGSKKMSSSAKPYRKVEKNEDYTKTDTSQNDGWPTT